MLKNNKIILILFIAIIMMSCAGANTNTNLTPKQDVTIMMETYNAQYDDVYSVMTNPASTPAQKDIARQKKAILSKIWPLLNAYSVLISKGGVPTEQDTLAITTLINQLTSLSTGGTK